MRLSQPAVGFINDCGKWDEEQIGTFAFSLLHFVAENWVNRYSWAAISSEDWNDPNAKSDGEDWRIGIDVGGQRCRAEWRGRQHWGNC
jgi:hypothetical protein